MICALAPSYRGSKYLFMDYSSILEAKIKVDSYIIFWKGAFVCFELQAYLVCTCFKVTSSSIHRVLFFESFEDNEKSLYYI